ncbi:trichodiene oxygenase [Colletotrichum limetticola]|uniref:Trichodiene oxygenase n=1 Tax=Colletotrichum limetticola TaxID=1209924 RepID=A0ABQ9QF23_9PEZI|nr:trichodiene oxygenase [Colletotrichum limetticola]
MSFIPEAITPTSVLSWQCAATLLVIWITYCLGRAIYNVSPLHPLSRFPGPKLAAASYAPECWYDFVMKGRYTYEIVKMHQIYGIATFATFGTIDHDLHRRRRAAVGKFFSRQQMLKLEPQVHASAQKLCDKLLSCAGADGEVVPLQDAYSCFTTDVITEYCFGESFGFLEQKEWTPNYRSAVYGALVHTFLFKFFPWTKIVMNAGPYLKNYLPRDTAIFINTYATVIPALVEKARDRKVTGAHRYQHSPNVFAALFDSDLPPEEKTVPRLTSEGAIMITAGTETTSYTLTMISFHLLSNPKILVKLTRELQGAVKDPKHLPNWPTLETLPYLNAVISEGLRLAPGGSMRTGRVATEEDLVYRGKWRPQGAEVDVDVCHVIPRGWAVSMSAIISHLDERMFPNAKEFIPERWIDENGQRRRELEAGFIPFSKGTRQCVGMPLAYSELYIALTSLVLRVFPRMKLYDTTLRDVEYDHDLGVPIPATENGVKVKII